MKAGILLVFFLVACSSSSSTYQSSFNQINNPQPSREVRDDIHYIYNEVILVSKDLSFDLEKNDTKEGWDLSKWKWDLSFPFTFEYSGNIYGFGGILGYGTNNYIDEKESNVRFDNIESAVKKIEALLSQSLLNQSEIGKYGMMSTLILISIMSLIVVVLCVFLLAYYREVKIRTEMLIFSSALEKSSLAIDKINERRKRHETYNKNDIREFTLPLINVCKLATERECFLIHFKKRFMSTPVLKSMIPANVIIELDSSELLNDILFFNGVSLHERVQNAPWEIRSDCYEMTVEKIKKDYKYIECCFENMDKYDSNKRKRVIFLSSIFLISLIYVVILLFYYISL